MKGRIDANLQNLALTAILTIGLTQASWAAIDPQINISTDTITFAELKSKLGGFEKQVTQFYYDRNTYQTKGFPTTDSGEGCKLVVEDVIFHDKVVGYWMGVGRGSSFDVNPTSQFRIYRYKNTITYAGNIGVSNEGNFYKLTFQMTEDNRPISTEIVSLSEGLAHHVLPDGSKETNEFTSTFVSICSFN